MKSLLKYLRALKRVGVVLYAVDVLVAAIHFPHDNDAPLTQQRVEAARVLRDGGFFLAIEPWPIPFLIFVHCVCRFKITRHMVPKFHALAIMIEYERAMYEQ